MYLDKINMFSDYVLYKNNMCIYLYIKGMQETQQNHNFYEASLLTVNMPELFTEKGSNRILFLLLCYIGYLYSLVYSTSDRMFPMVT